MSATLRDTAGRVIGYLDDTADAIRDVNGKPTAHRVAGDDKPATLLSAKAADWMAGRPVLMDLGPADVATAAVQADLGVPGLDCIADQVSAIRYVTHDRGVAYVQQPSNAVSLPLPLGVTGGAPPVVTPAFSAVNFTTMGYGLAAPLPRKLLGNADFDVRARTLHTLVELLRLAREYRVAQLLTTAASYAASNQIAAFAKWNGGASPVPLTDLFSALSKSFLPADTLIMPEQAAPFFHVAALQTFLQAGGTLPRILPARARYGATPSYVWSPTLPTNVAAVTTGGPDTLATSITLRWLGKDDKIPDSGISDGVYVRSYFDGSADTYWMIACHNDAEVIVHNRIGAVITGALA